MNFFSKKKKPEVEAPVEELEKTNEEEVIDVLKTCYDPEIPVDIYSLGLVYNIDVKVAELGDDMAEAKDIKIDMTLTSPACPVAETLPPEIESKIRREVKGVNRAEVNVVWEPPWNMDMMTEAAKLELGMM